MLGIVSISVNAGTPHPIMVITLNFLNKFNLLTRNKFSQLSISQSQKDLVWFRTFLAPIQIYLKFCMISIVYYQSNRRYTEFIYCIFVNLQNNMISDMPVLF